MINIAVIGVGGWGRNLARNYYEIPNSRLKYICDLDQSRLASLAAQLPGTITTSEFDAVLCDPEVQGVVIATPGPLHYSLCRRALEHDKDVYVEKPFVLQVDHAEHLIEVAQRRERILMVGHLLEYHPVINHLRQMIQNNELGDIYYVYTQRLNLGTVRRDENALWNFAPHDVSSILYLLNREPTDVSARGQC
jgi:predicted dehydrogenase